MGKSMDRNQHRNADGYWHERIDYVIGGERFWVCEADLHGRMAGTKIPNPQQEGRMHRADDDRVPDVWMAWGEIVPVAGDRRSW